MIINSGIAIGLFILCAAVMHGILPPQIIEAEHQQRLDGI